MVPLKSLDPEYHNLSIFYKGMPNHYLKQKQFHIRQLSVASFVDIMITKAQEKKKSCQSNRYFSGIPLSILETHTDRSCTGCDDTVILRYEDNVLAWTRGHLCDNFTHLSSKPGSKESL